MIKSIRSSLPRTPAELANDAAVAMLVGIAIAGMIVGRRLKASGHVVPDASLDMINPYVVGTEEGQAWHAGFNRGWAFDSRRAARALALQNQEEAYRAEVNKGLALTNAVNAERERVAALQAAFASKFTRPVAA